MGQAKQKILVIGGGIIGSAAAHRLQAAGADVTLLDAGGVGATEASFGWANASFYQTPEYHALRVAGLAAYERLQKQVNVPSRWCGSISWEEQGDAQQAQFADLSRLGYPCRFLDRAEIAQMEPALSHIPSRAIFFPNEAAIEQTELTANLQVAACGLGARVLSGFTVTEFVQQNGRICGAQTAEGRFEADQVLVAAGTGTQALLQSVGVALPMDPRPALVIRTLPASFTLNHVLATDFGEVRQLPDGALMTPASIGHQADASEALSDHPMMAAEITMGRLGTLFGEKALQLASVQLAHRPVPAGGFPAIGPAGTGLYVATMHSGITLAAVAAELIAQEMLSGPNTDSQDMLAAFRPDRFGKG